MIRVLIVDPDATRRRRLHRMLADNGLSVTEVHDAGDIAGVDLRNIDAVVGNAELGAARGIDLVKTLGDVPLILYTENASVRRAVEAMQQGAMDYLAIPFEPTDLVASIQRSLTRVSPGRHADRAPAVPMPMVGRCRAMLDLFERIQAVAERQCVVLIRGEAGSGKELVARAVHAAGPRRTMPLIALNCATIPAALIETELFGTEVAAHPGDDRARTGLIEAAQHGVLFLDEIGALAMPAQTRLMRALDEGSYLSVGASQGRPIDIVLIAATHRELRPLVEAGRFRADLYQRLSAVTLVVPPLRERGDDVVELAHWLLERTCHKLSKPQLVLSSAAIAAIRDYDWPGNVRELENALERAVILCDGREIEPALLAIASTRATPRPQPRLKVDDLDAETSLEGYFVKFVLDHQDSLTETELAIKLGISRKSLWERRQRLDIPRKRTRNRGSRRDVGA
jgi:two-component system, NtrC family, response regulator HydG